MPITAYISDRIFDGNTFLADHAVLVENGHVKALVPTKKIPQDAHQCALPDLQLAPALMDIQIYGGDGKMFSLFPSVQSLQATYNYCLRGGATHFMATVATNSSDIMEHAIKAVKSYWDKGLPGLLGLHLEGPYLNPEKKGAHILSHIRKPTLQTIQALMQRGKGVVRMMTIAPECCNDEIIRFLQDQGVVLSAGHSNASYDQAMHGFGLNIRTCTHLYNAMSSLQHRAPGLVGAIFDSEVYASIVADGIHVDFAAIRIAKKIMGKRLFLITDAVTEAASDSYTYLAQKDRFVTSDGTLAGSALTMIKAVKNCTERIGISLEEALQMASTTPAHVIGTGDSMGKIAPGYLANFVVFDQKLNVRKMIVEGIEIPLTTIHKGDAS